MRKRRHQKSTAAIIALSLIAPIAALIGAVVFDGERIARYWTSVEIDPSTNNANIIEAIDYDFGQANRRGILREIPDLDRSEGINVSSATAPDQTQIDFGSNPIVRIGDPDRTISGRHRYLLEYSLGTLIIDDAFSWNAVGTEWDVSISQAEIHILSTNEFVDPRCDQGSRGSFGGCTAEQVAPGHLVVQTDRLGSGDGVTVSSNIGAELAQVPAAPIPPESRALGSGPSALIPMAVAFVSALIASPFAGLFVRRRGREQIRHTTAASLGYIDDLDGLGGYRLAEEAEMARLVYPSLDPPPGVSAAQGGIIMAETVRPEHKVAWLLEAAALGEVELTEIRTSEVILRRGAVAPRPTSAHRLDSIFRKSNEVNLKKYDANFSSSWTDLEEDLEKWKDRSGFWDRAGDRQRTTAVVGGSTLVVLSAIAVAVTSGVTMRWSPFLLPLVILAALILGAALTVAVRSWELRVRTPEGTSKWIEVEALRRFLSELEPESALNMIEPDRFAGYTPWAVTFGLEDKWSKIIGKLKDDPRFSHIAPHHFYIANIGPSVLRATSTASTAPSSSGGGGSGGGVGGGGGGGGGGSW